MSLTLLVVDDDDLVIQSLKIALPATWRMLAARNEKQVHERGFHAALVDIHLSGDLARTEGLDVIRGLIQKHPHLEIIAMSGDLNRPLMEGCLKAGATRFLAKPLSVEEITLTLNKIEALFLLQDAATRTTSKRQWIGSGPTSQNIRRQIAQLRSEVGPVLIQGESGTGKEVVAQLLHSQEGPRPFVAVNVAAVPESLFESELFGHVKGSFTGAESNKMGLAEAAHGGDLFLDEIETLTLPMQAKLLRFLETGEVRRIGAKDSIQAQARVIAASNQPLHQMVSDGKFREDLLWRLGGKIIMLPPLRERTEDIPDLVHYFLQQDRVRRKEMEQEALEVLPNYPWPGNVRELRRTCEQLIVNAPLPIIRREDVLKALQATPQAAFAGKLDLDRGLAELVCEFESQIIKTALADSDIETAANRLRVSRSNLYKKIKDYGIVLPLS